MSSSTVRRLTASLTKSLGGDRVEDSQAQSFQSLETVPESFVAAFEKQFSGLDLSRDQQRAAAILFNKLRRGQMKGIEAILDMGRALNEAAQKFTSREFELLLKAGKAVMPIPEARASMYRRIAHDVDNGRLPRDLCPEAYSVAYSICTMSDTQIRVALDQGLVHPGVSRVAILKFKSSFLDKAEGHVFDVNLADLEREKVKLRREKQRLESELTACVEKIARVEQKIQRMTDTMLVAVD